MKCADACLVITFECPYCGWIDRTTPDDLDYGEIVWECDGCGEEFIIPDIME